MAQMGTALGNECLGCQSQDGNRNWLMSDVGWELHPRCRISSSGQVSEGKPLRQG